MPTHKCETYDFPEKTGKFDYLIAKAYTGNGRAQAIQDAIKEARDKAEKEGEDEMKDETCDRPCQRFIYVDASIEKVEFKDQPNNVACDITGTWKAGILCVKLSAHRPKK